MCYINVHQNLQSSQMWTSQMAGCCGFCWRLANSLLDLTGGAGMLSGSCWSLLEVLECYLDVAGAYWRFLEVLEQAHN